jgi:hypothetical protein
MPRNIPLVRQVSLVALAIVLAACGSDGFYRPFPADPDPSAAPGGSPDPDGGVGAATAWERATAGIRRDGTVPLETALAAFVVAFGPLPGVPDPDGELGFEGSGSGPLRWVLANWDGLTREQQEAVRRYIDPKGGTAARRGPDGAISWTGAMSASLDPRPRPLDPTTTAPLESFTEKLGEVKPQLEAKLKRKLKVPVELVFRDLPVKDGEVLLAETVPLESSGQPAKASSTSMARCQIQVNTRGQQLEGDELTSVVAHELFHCFQYDQPKVVGDAFKTPAWLAEGSAAWVGEEFAVIGSTVGQQYWTGWMKEARVSLSSRSYDAIGFYAHLAESKIDPWSLLDKMHAKSWKASGSADAYAVAVAADTDGRMIDAWGAGYARRTDLQPDWDMGGKAFPDFVKTTQASYEVIGNDHFVFGLPPLTGDVVKLEIDADVIVLKGHAEEGRGLIRFADGSVHRIVDSLGKPFCLKPGGCTCEAGSPSPGDWPAAGRGPALLGLTGHTSGSAVEVLSYEREVACSELPDFWFPEEPCLCPPGALGLDGSRRRA